MQEIGNQTCSHHFLSFYGSPVKPLVTTIVFTPHAVQVNAAINEIHKYEK